MRLDRVLAEGEAVNVLRQQGFICQESPDRIDQYVVAHSVIGGERTFTVEQMCRFAEGVGVMSSHLGAQATADSAKR